MGQVLESERERSTLRRWVAGIEAFVDMDSDMPVQQLLVFTWVALNEGKTARLLREDLNMPSSTASRSLAALSKVHRLGRPGLGLIDSEENQQDRRAKNLFLTEKGRRLARRLAQS